MVEIRYRAHLRALTQKEKEILEAASIKEVLSHIKRVYGKEACKEASRMIIAVNGISICLTQNKKTKRPRGAEIDFFPICGGG